ncbi:MATE family efflux transporter [Aquimarina aquimarini]|uniref:MATE family efflux transporter n=1 Tax=Aquimarina aquimarini TaxID=1191734 RepID=UPI001900FE98|nr:MATE family efflux transporter [Aquimarina aquimarini]
MNDQVQKQFILTSNMWPVMWKLSWPAIIAMVLYGFNTLLDAVFVGAFIGENALAGVSIAYPLASFVLGIGSLIGTGAGSLLSIALGANDVEEQQRLLGNFNSLNILCTVIYMILALIFAEPLVKMMGGSGEPLELGVTYFRISVFGAFFWIYGLASNMVVRAEGKMKKAALVMGIGLIVNIIFNYVLIVVMDCGVAGASWASNIGMLVYSILGYLYFNSKKTSFLSLPNTFYWDKEIIKSIVSMGLPSLIMMFMTIVQAVVIFNAIANHGSVFEVAFYGVAFRVLSFILTPIYGLMRALQPVVGINYGGKKYKRVIQSFWVFSITGTLIILPLWGCMMIAPQFILATMLEAGSLSSDSIWNFRMFISILPVLPIVFNGMTFFSAINKGKPAAIIGLVRQLIFYVPLMLILPSIYGTSSIYWGTALIDTVIVAYTMILVLIEFKRLKSLKLETNII